MEHDTETRITTKTKINRKITSRRVIFLLMFYEFYFIMGYIK